MCHRKRAIATLCTVPLYLICFSPIIHNLAADQAIDRWGALQLLICCTAAIVLNCIRALLSRCVHLKKFHATVKALCTYAISAGALIPSLFLFPALRKTLSMAGLSQQRFTQELLLLHRYEIQYLILSLLLFFIIPGILFVFDNREKW